MATPTPMINHDPTSPAIQLDTMNKDISATSNMPSSDPTTTSPAIGSNITLQVTPPTPPPRYNAQQLLRLVPSAMQRNLRPCAESLKIRLDEENANVKAKESQTPAVVPVTMPEAKVEAAAVDPKKISADAVSKAVVEQVPVDKSDGQVDGEVDDVAWEEFVSAMAKAIEIQGPDGEEERAEAAKLIDKEILEVFDDVTKGAAEKAKAFVVEIREVPDDVKKAASKTVEAVVPGIEDTTSKSKTAELTAEKIQQDAKKGKPVIKGVDNDENVRSATRNTESEVKDDKLAAKLKGLGIKADETSGKKVTFEEKSDVTKEAEKGTANNEAPKKKKKKGSRTRYADGTPKAKKVAPTGFEEFYADAPITPEEYQDEMQNMYHHSRDFAERIETCISRYRSKRKLNSLRGDMFNKYLGLGGVDTGVGQFQGGAKRERANDNAIPDADIDNDYDGPTVHNICEEYRPMFDGDSIFDTSQNAVSKYYNPLAPQNWTVDFIGIAKAFLSKKAPWTFGVSEKATIDAYCEVVNNFLAYVLMHSVCPEYTNEILAAQKIARLVKKELWAIKTLMDVFPGPFHTALAIVSDPKGFLAETRLCTPAQLETAKEFKGEEFNVNKHMTFEQCMAVVEVTLTLMGTEAQIDTLLPLVEKMKKGDRLPVVRTEECTFEVLSISPPSQETVDDFEAFSERFEIKPTGFLFVRPWGSSAEEQPEDLTPAEARKAAKAKQEALEARRRRDADPQNAFKLDGDLTPTESFVISADILEHCFVGMKFECTVKTIGAGMGDGKEGGGVEGQLRFIDSLNAVHVSFSESVDNERMEGWRIPVETDRIPPTCNDEGADYSPEHRDADDKKKGKGKSENGEEDGE